MDWSAKMLGLADDFLLEKKKGGGVILVRPAGYMIRRRLTSGLGIRGGVDSRHGGARTSVGEPRREGPDRAGRREGEVRPETGHVRQHADAFARREGRSKRKDQAEDRLRFSWAYRSKPSA